MSIQVIPAGSTYRIELFSLPSMFRIFVQSFAGRYEAVPHPSRTLQNSPCLVGICLHSNPSQGYSSQAMASASQGGCICQFRVAGWPLIAFLFTSISPNSSFGTEYIISCFSKASLSAIPAAPSFVIDRRSGQGGSD